jgi:Fe-S-cluster containining protein
MELLYKIMGVYAQIDQQVATFQLRTGLRCPNGCGICCPEAEVYASSIEMLPAANELLLRGESQLWLETIMAAGPDGICVFYQKNVLNATGHCDHYSLRPAVCRLFGFASVRNRLGERVLSTCKVLKTNFVQDTAKAVEYQNEAPCFSQFSPLLMDIDASATRLLPINEALRQAIMRLGLQMQMAHGEKLSTHTAA